MASISVRLPDDLEQKLDALCQATGRTRSFLTLTALRQYLKQEEWQALAIKTAVDRADSGVARYASHEAVDDWLSRWGTKDESKAPPCE